MGQYFAESFQRIPAFTRFRSRILSLVSHRDRSQATLVLSIRHGTDVASAPPKTSPLTL
jgi:hypothetical protein